MAMDGYGPAALAKIHPRFRTPALAIISVGVLSLLLALSGSFVQLALLSVVARLCTYIGTSVSVLVLRRRYGDREQALHLPGGPLIPRSEERRGGKEGVSTFRSRWAPYN